LSSAVIALQPAVSEGPMMIETFFAISAFASCTSTCGLD